MCLISNEVTRAWTFLQLQNCTNDFLRSAIATIGVTCYGFVTTPVFPGTGSGYIPPAAENDETVTGFANVTLKDHSTVEAIALQSHAGKPGTQKNSGERTLRHRTTGGNR
jgi:hypothetical protein